MVPCPVPIDAHGDVAALAMEREKDAHRLGTEAQFGSRITDVGNDLANEFGVIDLGTGGDFPSQDDKVGRA